jgi:glycosyltransferase involved in cell wall biosynthesis
MPLDPAMADRRSGEVVTDASWRARARSLQEEALPSGRVVVSCPAPFGAGGLGRHLEEIVAALDRRGQPHEHISKPAVVSESQNPYSRALITALAMPTRSSPALRMWKASVGFDRDAARRLPPADHLIAFNGTALAQFRAGRRAGMESISLIAANSHMRRVIRQHDRAYRQYPLEQPWATRLLKRNLAEYAAAQRIYVASSYVWESFLEEGFPDELLSLFPLTPHPRYQPAGRHDRSDTFDIAYVGSLTVHKGVPLLIDAFRRVPHADMRLVLVGGWKTRSMRRFIEGACDEDGRISVRPGDPLPHLRRARLYVHPAYEDGFAYAPAEALACGVPVIVSEDTGMKDLISTDHDGLVLPTGDLGALTEAIDAAYRGEILGG